MVLKGAVLDNGCNCVCKFNGYGERRIEIMYINKREANQLERMLFGKCSIYIHLKISYYIRV